MNKYQSQIDKLSDHLMAQELAFELRKRQRTAEAKLVFTSAINWLVTEALTANIGNSRGSFSVSRNRNHYTKENPDRTGLVPWGLSYETAVSDPKTSTGALEMPVGWRLSERGQKRVFQQKWRSVKKQDHPICSHEQFAGIFKGCSGKNLIYSQA